MMILQPAVISTPLTHIIYLSFWPYVFPSDGKIAEILPFTKMVLPINLEITVQYQFYP